MPVLCCRVYIFSLIFQTHFGVLRICTLFAWLHRIKIDFPPKPKSDTHFHKQKQRSTLIHTQPGKGHQRFEPIIYGKFVFSRRSAYRRLWKWRARKQCFIATKRNNFLSGMVCNRLHLIESFPDRKVHGANVGPTWGRQDPGWSHVGPMNLAIWELCPPNCVRIYIGFSMATRKGF